MRVIVITLQISKKNSPYLYNIPERYIEDIVNRALELYINMDSDNSNYIEDKIQEVIHKIDNIQIPETVFISETKETTESNIIENKVNVIESNIVSPEGYDDIDMDSFFS